MNEKKSKKRSLIWLTDIVTILTIIVTFSPIVLPQHQDDPLIGGIPYTMVTGFLVSILFVILTGILSYWQKKHTNDR